MTDTWRFIVIMILVLAVATLLPFVVNAQHSRSPQAREGHHGDCSKMTGIKQARCERHERMYEKCHAIRGEAHHDCNREYIRSNPLDCARLGGSDAKACAAEVKTVKECGTVPRRDFFRCVREALHADPRH